MKAIGDRLDGAYLGDLGQPIAMFILKSQGMSNPLHIEEVGALKLIVGNPPKRKVWSGIARYKWEIHLTYRWVGLGVQAWGFDLWSCLVVENQKQFIR